MDYKIRMKKNYPSQVHGRPTLYKGQIYSVPEGVSVKVADKAIRAGAAERVAEKAKPVKMDDETPKTRKSMMGAPENKSASPASKSSLD